MLSLPIIGFIILGIGVVGGKVFGGEMGCGGCLLIIGLVLILLFGAAIGLLTSMGGGGFL